MNQVAENSRIEIVVMMSSPCLKIAEIGGYRIACEP